MYKIKKILLLITKLNKKIMDKLDSSTLQGIEGVIFMAVFVIIFLTIFVFDKETMDKVREFCLNRTKPKAVQRRHRFCVILGTPAAMAICHCLASVMGEEAEKLPCNTFGNWCVTSLSYFLYVGILLVVILGALIYRNLGESPQRQE